MLIWSLAIVACAALLGLVLVAEARWARARSDRHFALLVQTLDEHLRQISEDVVSGLERSNVSGGALAPDLGLTVDFDDALDRVLGKAAELTEAQAAAVRVRGLDGDEITRSIGSVGGTGALDALLAAPAVQFSAMSVEWTYPDDGWSAATCRSAVAVPIVEDGVVTGVLGSFGLRPGAFSADHVRSLQRLAAEAAPGIRNARLFSDIARRTVIDAVTGIRNRAGYELELDREVARARRTGRPLSLVVLGVAPTAQTSRPDPAAEDLVARDFSAVLTRVARSTDVLCRRQGTEFAALLPETARTGAGRFCARVRVAAAANALSHVGSLSLESGMAEWQPDESGASLDARAAVGTAHEPDASLGLLAVIGRPRGDGTPLRTRATDGRGGPRAGDDAERAFLEELAAHVIRARERAHPLAVLLLEVEAVESLAVRTGADGAERVLADVGGRVAQHVDGKGWSSRLGASRFAAVLDQGSVGEAESLVVVLQESLEGWPSTDAADVGPLRLSAGITDLAARDTAESVLRRARYALWQADQAGNGTIVVARTDSHRPT